ncbi:outer membrane lipoprotein carrier protein LolA [Oscillatoria amoena NRMC-F 0135]|jgi:outer membrane lipoprotein-sorting protein|nr:outer membrane lipoprotein carrier protein LolA [Oscillatoria amoena NRMC-F 0135]
MRAAKLLLGAWAVVGFLAPASSAAALSQAEILSRFDQNAKNFRNMSAKIERIDYTAVLKDEEKESGTIVVWRKKPGVVEMRIDIAQPDEKKIGYAGKKAMIYLPKINTVQIFDVGKYDSLISQGILIGFGTSSAELQKSYSMKVLGEEAVQGRAATRIELTPKGDSPLMKLKKIEVWVQHSDGYPLRQKLFQGSGDYNQATYSDMKINPPVSEEQVRLPLPKDVKKEYPAK